MYIQWVFIGLSLTKCLINTLLYQTYNPINFDFVYMYSDLFQIDVVSSTLFFFSSLYTVDYLLRCTTVIFVVLYCRICTSVHTENQRLSGCKRHVLHVICLMQDVTIPYCCLCVWIKAELHKPGDSCVGPADASTTVYSIPMCPVML